MFVRRLWPALVVVALFLTSTPASAVGDGDPVVVSPGTSVPHNWAGPVTIDFSGAPVADYYIDIECGNFDYYESVDYYYDGSQNIFTWHPPAIGGPTSCVLNVWNAYGLDLYRTFAVAAPAMDIHDPSAVPARFYPFVRDGYRDTAKIGYRLNQRAQVTATVRSSSGVRVRSFNVGYQDGGWRSWSWSGRRDNGTLVRAGTYTVTMRATNAAGSTDTVTRTVTATTAIVTRRYQKRRWGNQGAGSTSGNCRITWSSYEGTADLDCWGGSYARVTYNFRIPANAYNLGWRIVSERSSADICCTGGFTQSGARTSATNVRLRGQVSGWRARTLYSAWVFYTAKVRI